MPEYFFDRLKITRSINICRLPNLRQSLNLAMRQASIFRNAKIAAYTTFKSNQFQKFAFSVTQSTGSICRIPR